MYANRIAHITAFLTSHGTAKEGNVLLNDLLNTFYLRLYGVTSHHERTLLPIFD